MWKSFSIAKKIWLSLAILILGYFITMVFGFISGRQTESQLQYVSDSIFPATKHSQAALTAFNEQIKLYNDAVMMGDADLVETANTKANETKEALGSMAELPGLKNRVRSDIKKTLNQFVSFTNSAQNAYTAMSNTAMGEENRGLEKGGNLGETVARLAQETDGLREKLADFTEDFSNNLKEELLGISKKTKQQRYLNMVVFFCVVICAAILVWIIISRSITGPINHIIETMNDGADRVASTSSQVASASQSLAQGSSEQAASIEETSSSLEEMSSMTKQNAENASQADSLMKETNQVVGKANHDMANLTSSMEEISKASQETSKIVKTIDEIAFQTNLLALNAAVEAARAGEAGAGFAVVADEVRNLALRSAEAAKSTANLIESTVMKINGGVELVSTASDAFSEVASSAAKVGTLVGDIAAASSQQAQGIEQVNNAVNEMDKITQQTAANAEESASAAEVMSAQADQMKTMVNELNKLVGGDSTSSLTFSKGMTRNEAEFEEIGVPEGRHTPKGLMAPRKRELRPEQIIPLNEYDDF